MTNPLRVAVCWSGLTQVTNAAKFNKKLLDDLTESSNGEVSFEHYCHFWNSDNRYPYDLETQDLIRDCFTEIDRLPLEKKENTEKIIHAIQPTLLAYSSFNEISWVFKERFMPSEPVVYEGFDKRFKSISHNIIKKSNVDFKRNVFAQTEIWGYKLHVDCSGVVNKLAQFYGFEKSVALAKESNNTYDIILRLRYDSALIPRDMDALVRIMHYSKSVDSMMVNDFRRYTFDHANREYITDYFTNNNINELVGTNFGLDDVVFWGPPSCIFELAKDLFKNAADLFCSPLRLDAGTAPENLWFNVIKNKNIPCQSASSMNVHIGRALIRKESDLDILKEMEFDTWIFQNNITDSYRVPGLSYTDRLADVDWSNPRRYFIEPDNYILAKMLFQIYAA